MSRYTRYAAAALLAAGLSLQGELVPAQDFGPPGAAIDGSGDYEVLTSGPIHEAFANPYSPDPVPGMIVEVQPPDPIDEMPPDIAPSGPDVQWIPGYWGWDVAREGFVWISGVWRSMPPRQQWIPGYWAPVEEGFQWVSGFWTSEELQELVYLPYPPESQEMGPTSPQPSPNHFWVPGIWMFEGNRYQWRPGHWSPTYEGWVWVPAQYIWTPYGAVYTNGFWDRTVVERGMLFCPIVFHQPDIVFARYQFTPMVVVDTRPLLVHMFVSPRYNHYFFGNYYGFDFGPRTLLPWHAYWNRPGYYDPLLTYYDWSFGRRNVNFIQRLQIWNQYFITNVNYRPPRTFADQRRFVDRFGRDRDGLFSRYAFSRPLDEFVADHDDHRRFHRLERGQRQELVDLTRDTRQLQRQRAELEAGLATRGRTDDDARRPQIRQPRTVQLSGLDRVRREQRAWRGRIDQERQPAEERAEARRGDAERGRTEGQRGRLARPAEILPELPPDANIPQRAGRADDDARPGRGPQLPGARPETAGQPGRGEPRIGARDRDEDRGPLPRGRRDIESPAERAQQQPFRPGVSPRTDDQPGARRGQPGQRDLQPGVTRSAEDTPQDGRRDLRPGAAPRDDDRPGARRGQPDQRDAQPGLSPGATRDQPGRPGRGGQPPTLDQLRERMSTPRGDAQQRETRRPSGPVPGAQPGATRPGVTQPGEPAQRPGLTPSPRPGQSPGARSLDDLRSRGRGTQTPQALPPGRSDSDRVGRPAQPGASGQRGDALRQQESRFRGQPGFGQPPTAQPRPTSPPAGAQPGAQGPQGGAAPPIGRQPSREVPRAAPQPGRSAPAARPAVPQQRPQPAARPQAPQQRSQPAARPQAPQQRQQPAARPQPQRPQPAAQPQRSPAPAPKATPAPRSGRSDRDRDKGKGKGKD